MVVMSLSGSRSTRPAYRLPLRVPERGWVATECRKNNHDRHVRDVPLQEGRLVLLRDFSVKGCNKIQDPWGSVVYRVLKAPKDRGSVYTIGPFFLFTCCHNSLVEIPRVALSGFGVRVQYLY